MSSKKTVNVLRHVDFATGCYVDGEGVTLCDASNIRRIQLPSGEIRIAGAEKSEGKIFVTVDDTVYMSSDGVNFTLQERMAITDPFIFEWVLDDKPIFSIFSKSRLTSYSEGTISQNNYVMSLRTGAYFCDRLFGVDYYDGLTLRWAGTEGFNDWNENVRSSGWIKLTGEKGKIIQLVPFKGKLVAVCEYGLTVIDAAKKPEDFAMVFVDGRCGKIYKNTACVVGDRLVFYTNGGACYFDGGKIVRIPEKYKVNPPLDRPVLAAGLNGKYYIAGIIGRSGDRGVVCINLDTGNSAVIDCAVDALFVYDAVYFFRKQYMGYFGGTGNFNLKTKPIDFGTDKPKTVTSLYVGDAPVNVTISNGRVSRTYSYITGCVHPRLRGNSFTVTASGTCSVKSIELTAEVGNAV